jgi:hypothetical protein
MKTQLNTYIDAEIADALRERAAEVGVSANALTALGLRYVLQIAPERLREWAARQKGTRGRYANAALIPRERAVLDALCAAEREEKSGAKWFSAAEVSSKAGMRHAEGYGVLERLRLRGLVASLVMNPEKVDAWDRPLRSDWQLTDEGRKLAG